MNVQKIEEIISSYLEEKESQYAIMINGPWGSGKTYFFRKVLTSKISKIKVADTKDNFSSLYISLNGINSLSQLHKHVFTSIFLGDKDHKKVKGIKGLISHVTDIGKRLLTKHKGLDFIFESFTVFDFIDLQRIVLCFDDLVYISVHLTPLFRFYLTPSFRSN